MNIQTSNQISDAVNDALIAAQREYSVLRAELDRAADSARGTWGLSEERAEKARVSDACGHADTMRNVLQRVQRVLWGYSLNSESAAFIRNNRHLLPNGVWESVTTVFTANGITMPESE